jgi:hypothetical protein
MFQTSFQRSQFHIENFENSYKNIVTRSFFKIGQSTVSLVYNRFFNVIIKFETLQRICEEAKAKISSTWFVSENVRLVKALNFVHNGKFLFKAEKIEG